MMPQKAFITGINGQDGSYLAELLLEKGYEVHGLVRRETFEGAGNKLFNLHRILDKITLHYGSASNQLCISKLINDIQPDECYHLAATSFVSYDLAAETEILANNFNSTHFLLASIKESCPKCKFYFAGSSEMFGAPSEYPQTENTVFEPRSIYGISKLAAAQLSKSYRKQHQIFTCNGILYNHESPRRGEAFVTRKITHQVARIANGLVDKLVLGNLDAKRDWGYAPEYVEAMWRMLNHDEPGDYIVATNQLHTVKDIVQCAFECVSLDYNDYVIVDEKFHRTNEKIPLVGDYTKAKRILEWQSQKTVFQVIEEMVAWDLYLMKQAHVV
tara:strand:- start:27371 stop:28360 length:990 start_codon:yes stop_codon:yes gene_type:complete